jgi:hypothetical protein
MCSHALVLQPWEPCIIHHCIDFRHHGVHRTDAELSLHLIPSEGNLITDLMACSTGAFLFYHSTKNLPRLITNTISICHEIVNLRTSMLIYRKSGIRVIIIPRVTNGVIRRSACCAINNIKKMCFIRFK